ncbi:hypothetical protein, partial [uncultured Paracoccus sp.]|uniref:hypothetical protein n=1 Tax=uncultured Paracoccus sp. TaxID=189685 RepID=UPI0025980FDA
NLKVVGSNPTPATNDNCETSVAQSAEVFALRRKRKDSGKIALNVDLDPILPRRQHDLVH